MNSSTAVVKGAARAATLLGMLPLVLQVLAPVSWKDMISDWASTMPSTPSRMAMD